MHSNYLRQALGRGTLLLLAAMLALPLGLPPLPGQPGTAVAAAAGIPTLQPDSSPQGVRVPAVAATVSSSQPGHGPELLMDGDYDDSALSWRPAAQPTAAEPQWVQLDLGQLRTVGALEAAVTGTDGPKQYEIQISEDGNRFQTVAARATTSSRTLFASWDRMPARYVKLIIADSFGPGSSINEITLFPDALPHRVGILSCFPDMKNFGDSGLDALLAQGQQLMNLCVSISDPASPGINLMPELIDDQLYPHGIADEDVLDYVSNPDNYSWEYAEDMLARFTDIGMDVWLGFSGFSSRAFPSFYSTIVDEIGRTIEHRDFFNSLHNETVIEVAKQTMKHFDSNPHMRKFSILGPGWYGGIEYYSGHNPELLAVYSDSAQASFRAWLEEKYTSISALNTSWGSSYTAFAEISSPLPNRSNPAVVDSRPEWADLMFWKLEYMDNFLDDYMQAMRSVSDKQIHVEVDGGYQSAPMETGESMGKIARDFSKYDNIIFGNSNLDAPYGVAQYTATARFYGLSGSMDDTAQPFDKAQTDNAFNFLGRGVDMLAHSALGWDYIAFNGNTGHWDPDGDYSGNELYQYTKDNAKKYRAIDPEPEGPEVVIFNPWYANLFRQGYNRNDHNFIYDGDHGISWYGAPFANWAHYLQTPDILDDFPIEDGALDNYKVFISPNMGTALTSDDAEVRILSWVEDGGAFASFGINGFNYRVNLDSQRVTGGDTVDDWIMGLLAGAQASPRTGTAVRVSAGAPAWLQALAAGAAAEVPTGPTADNQALLISQLPANAVPVLEDEAGNAIMVELAVGEGSVLFSTLPVADNALFKDSFMSKLLSDYADSRGIKRTVTADPEKFHVVDAGVDSYSGKRVIEVARNGAAGPSDLLVLRHASSLDNTAAIIDLNWEKDGMLEYTFKPGEVFIYIPGTDGAIAASGTIADMNGEQRVTLDLGNRYPLTTIAISAEQPLAPLAFAAGSFGPNWQATGAAFGTAPVPGMGSGSGGGSGGGSSGSGGSADALAGPIATTAVDSSATGRLKSAPFIVSADALAFYAAGYAGDKGAAPAAGSASKLIADFEAGDWSELEYVDASVFGAAPATGGAGWVGGGDGYYAASSTGGQKGRLQTKPFTIDRPTLAFDGAGWNGTVYGPGPWPYDLGNRFYLKDAQTDAILMEEVPTNRVGDSGNMKTYIWDVSAWAGREVYFEAIDAIGDAEAAVYGGGFDWIAVDNIKLIGEPFGTEGIVEGQNRFVLKAVDGTILRSAFPPDSAAYELAYWDVSNLKGRTVYMEAADGMDDSSEGWLTLTAPFTLPAKDGAEDSYWSFESGAYADWEVTGDAFGNAPNSRFLGRPLGTSNGTYWADTLAAGEDKTGTLTSKPFVIDKPILSFLAAGWNGQGGYNPPRNYYELLDENGQQLRMATPPGQSSQPLNQFIPRYWDVSDLLGQTVRFRMVDGDASSGYAWLALDSIKQMNNWDFEMGSYSSWTAAGTAFGSSPAALGGPYAALGARGMHWVDSSTGGSSATGTLTSELFVLDSDRLRFLAAGYSDQGANEYRLLDASGQVLASAAPPDSDSFVPLQLHAPGIAGQQVRFQAVDGSTDVKLGWLAFDDLNERRLLPGQIGIRLSQDGAVWMDETLLDGSGATSLAHTVTSGGTYRYVQLAIAGGRIDSGFLQLVRLLQPASAWTGTLDASGRLDLGQLRPISSLEAQFASADARSYTVEASTDGLAWFPAYRVLGDDSAHASLVFPALEARYVRLAGLAAGDSPQAMAASYVAPPELDLARIPAPTDGSGAPGGEGPDGEPGEGPGGGEGPGNGSGPPPGSGEGEAGEEPQTGAQIELVATPGSGTAVIKVLLAAVANTGSSPNGGGTANLSIEDWAKLAQLAGEALERGQAVQLAIEATALPGATATSLQFPPGSLAALGQSKPWTMEIDFPAGTIRFDAAAVAAIAAATEDETGGLRFAWPGAGSSAGSNAYSISLQVGNQPFSSLGRGKAHINLPYPLAAGNQPLALFAEFSRANHAAGTTALRGGYNAVQESLHFTTGILGDFEVRYNEVRFTDVAEADWYADPVAYLAARGIINGKGTGRFAPADAITRAEFLVMAMRAYGIAPANLSDSADVANWADVTGPAVLQGSVDSLNRANSAILPFEDAGNSYYTPYLSAAQQLGIVNGTGNNRFRPEAPISRQDMLVLLYRMLERLEELPEPAAAETAIAFADAAQITPYAHEAVQHFAQAGIIVGYRNAAMPADQASRAQTAQILYRLFNSGS